MGRRSTGLAHRVLRDGQFLGHEFEIHGGGNDLRFPHHENELAQSGGLGHAFARIWMHNGMLELDAAKMSKSLGNVVTLRNVLDVWGREALLVFHLSGAWSKPVDFDDEVMQQAAARADGFRDVFRNAHTPAPEGDWKRFSDALEDDFNTPAALAVMHEWRITSCCDAPSRYSGSSPSQRLTRCRRTSRSSLGDDRPRGRRTTSTRPIVFARSSRQRAGKCGTSRAAIGSSNSGDARPRLRAAAGSGTPARPARAQRAVGDRARRCADPWLDSGPRLQVKPERLLSEAAGTRDHQGVVAWCAPFRYADAYELARADQPLLVCLDQVTDPHNLGAVVRSAEGAGATGVVLPAHGSVRVTPAVCRASAGAVEHLPVAVVQNLARYLAEIKGRTCGPTRRTRRDRSRCGTLTSRGRRPRAGGGGKRRSPARPPHVRRSRLHPARRQRRVPERERRRGAAPVRGAPPAGGEE